VTAPTAVEATSFCAVNSAAARNGLGFLNAWHRARFRFHGPCALMVFYREAASDRGDSLVAIITTGHNALCLSFAPDRRIYSARVSVLRIPEHK